MAKGVKYRIEYDNFHAQQLKIDILFEGFVGSVTSITGSNEPFVKKTEQSSADISKGGILDSDFFIQALTGNGFSLSDFTSENYGDIVFNYYKDAVLIYSGVIAPFESSQELLPDGLTSLSLSAETGLKQLYKETIKNEDDTFLSGRYKLIEVLAKALRLLEVPNTFNIVSEINTLVYVDGVQKNSTLDFFENYIDAEAFKLAPNTWMSAYETIEAILGGVYTLKLHAGKWVIAHYLGDTQASKYITIYNNLGVKQSRTSTTKTTRALSTQTVLKGGTEGKQFSKSRLEIKQNILSLINRLPNPLFSYSSFDIADWTNESSFSSVEHGGDGSNTTPYYFKINGSVYSPSGGSDTEFLQSTPFSWYPIGESAFASRDLAKYHDNNEQLKFNLNANHGTGISGSRVQIVATWSNLRNFSEQPTAVILDAEPVYDNVTYYFTNDGWTSTPGFYNTESNDNEEIILTAPPIRLSTSLKYKALSLGTYVLETPPTVSVSILLFRGERKKIGESTAEEVGYTYFVKYFALSSSVWTNENQNVLDIGNRLFTSDANTDREAKETIEYNIYGAVSPIAFGSIFETNVSTAAINGYKRLGGTTITDYTLFLAKTYLRGIDTRLSTLNITLFDNSTLESDLFTFEGKTYRILSYEWQSRMNMHKLRLVQIAYSGSSISEVVSEREFSEVIKAVDNFDSIGKIKTIFAIDPNFIYTTSKGVQLNPKLDGIQSFNPTGGFMNLLIEGNEDTSGTNYINESGDIVGFIRPITDAISFQAADNFSFDLKSSLLSQNSIFTLPNIAAATIATDSTAWMLGATNALTAKDYIGSVSGDFDIGIKRAGTEILTIKSTGIDLYDNRLDVGAIQYKLDTSQISGEGKVTWNDTYGTLEVGLKGGNVTHRMGQSSFVYVKHEDNSGLSKGNVIYPVGSNGVNKTVRLALANAESTSSNTFAVVAENAIGGEKAFSVTYGNIEGLDTSALTEGAAIYLSTTVAGGFTSTKPSAPNHIVLIGFCIRSHANLGVIFVKIQNGFELDEIHNVGISSLANNNILAYESSTSLWKNKTLIDLGVLSGTGNANEIAYFTAPNTITSLPIATYPSLTEVSYVKGVTNSIQDQIDIKFNIASFTDVAVTSKLLTGLSISGTSVAASDSILVAIGKLQAQVTAQLGGLIFQSTWNATTNTPTITSSTGTKGHYYIVSTAGSTSIDGESDWKAKDWVVFNGATWDKVDNTDSVSSVNGEVGAVSLTTDDITEGVTNLYYTDAAVRGAISESIIGIDYNNSTGIFSTTLGYGIPTTIKQGEWDTAYTLASSSWLLNGNTIGAKKTIGSLDAYDVGIVREGTEIVTILSTGATITGKVTATSAAITGLTTNYLPKAGAAGLLGNSVIYDNGTSVGIGTASPAAKLDVAGNIIGLGALNIYTVNGTTDGYITITNGTASNSGYIQFRKPGNVRLGYIGFSSGNMNYVAENSATHYFSGGKVVAATGFQFTTGAASGYILQSDASGNASWASPTSIQSYQGAWNPTTNSPSLANGTGTQGHFYRILNDYSRDLGAGSIDWTAGNDVRYNGSVWEELPVGSLAIASASVLGGVKLGTTLEIDGVGVLDQKSGIATAGTYRSITVDTYGRVTSGTNPTTIAGYGITDFSSLWTASMSTFIGAAPTTLDTWLELVAEIQDTDTDVTGLITSVATNASNLTALTSGLTADYVSKWNGSKYVNSHLQSRTNDLYTVKDIVTTSSIYASGGVSAGSAFYLGTVGSIGYVGTPYTDADLTINGNYYSISMSSFRQADIYMQPNAGKVVIGTKGALSGTLEKFNVDGNIRYSGLLKPSGTAGTAGQFLGTDGTNDEWKTLTVANILETLTITNGSFSRDLYGLHLAPTGTDAFFVGFDVSSGIGVFRNKIWSDTEEVSFVEHGFDIYNDGRFGIVTEDGNFRHYAFTDELGTSGGTVGTLQTVTDNGSISTNRLQYSTGGETVNYAIASDITYASSLDAVLANGNIATDKTIEFKSNSSRSILQFKKLDNTLLGGLSMIQGSENSVELFNLQSSIGIQLKSDGKARFGKATGTYIEHDFLTTDTLSTKYNVGGVYKGGLEILNTGVLKMQAESGLWINSSGNCVFKSTGLSIGTADYNIYINAEGSDIGDVYIGRASNGLDSKLELHGSAFNFWIASTPSDGQQAVFQYDGTLGKWLLKFIP